MKYNAQHQSHTLPNVAIVVAIALVITASGSPARAQTETVLHTFHGATEGFDNSAAAGLVRDRDGTLYGAMSMGGAGRISCNLLGGPGCGTIFKLEPNGRLTVLHNFTGGLDGSAPSAGSLAVGEHGSLYGTTSSGGVYGGGTVFKLDPPGNESVLYQFTNGAEGGSPLGGVIRDAAGNLYGTTYGGGSFGGMCGTGGCGVVFKLDPGGKETVLHSFTGPDGFGPEAGLVADEKGNLYGTTGSGGAYGWGTAFKVDAAGKETVLHSFTGGADGANPTAPLIRDEQGSLYGTTTSGGNGNGVVFKLGSTGKETVLYTFTGGADGGSPGAGVIRDADGNLYGTTLFGGINFNGVVFKLDPKGNETVLYRFTGGTDGGTPYAPVTLDRQGNLYGTAELGGRIAGMCAAGCGVIFKLTLHEDSTGK